MLVVCFSILEGTLDIQERIENGLAALLELLKGKFWLQIPELGMHVWK